MTLITIRQTGAWGDSPNAAVSFDRRGEDPVTIADPFSPAEETCLAWYFEEHLKFPFTKQVQAKQAAESITRYGEALFKQVFPEKLYARYFALMQQGVNRFTFEIIGSPEFHRLHWEALKDPDLDKPFVVDAPMVRRTPDPPVVAFDLQESPTINLLVVTARPGGRRDVGYRTISRPLVERLREAKIPVNVEILRPGAYKALVDHLTAVRDRQGVGYYHIIHFDLHGAVSRYDALQTSDEGTVPFLYQVQLADRDCNRGTITPYDGEKAFLFFESLQENVFDPAAAEELAGLLRDHHIPVVILNACQSGKQTEKMTTNEASLGSRLLQSGVQTVIAMGYSVTVSAAGLLMQTLYQQLFQQNDLGGAICHARLALFNDKKRRVYFNQRINLEDWLLPVVYQSGERTTLPLRPFSFEEQAAYFGEQAGRYYAPEPSYGFVGRDVDILEIEKQLLSYSAGKRRNLLLLRGMGGAGKTTLLRYLGEWWQTTRFVDQVFYFGYDEKAWTLHQVMDQIAQQLFNTPLTPLKGGLSSSSVLNSPLEGKYSNSPLEGKYSNSPLEGGRGVSLQLMQFRAMPLKTQQQMLAQKLRSERHLLILDNLESITGAHLAIRNTLPPAERDALAGFLADLRDGQTLVLLGSRGGEEWLTHGSNAPLRANDIYDLPGLDPEAASTLAERILERYMTDVKKRNAYRESEEFRRLLKLLDGYPLPLEIVLANLARQTPADILKALQAGDVNLDAKDAQSKTESILKCIDYSHSNLSPDAQQLLLCLAPFTGVINMDFIEQYTQQLQQQPALAGLPFDRWPEVLQEAANWGLLTPHEVPGFLHLQPIFPYFLRTRLEDTPRSPLKGGLSSPSADSPLEGGQGSVKSPLEGGQGGVRPAIETAFRQHYNGIGAMLGGLLESKDPQERQVGQLLTRLEYENLHTALNLALDAQASILNPYNALFFYLYKTQEHQRIQQLSQITLANLENYPAEVLAGQIGAEFVTVLDRIANSQLELKQYAAAEASYQKALSIWLNNKSYEPSQIKKMSATFYHQLGRVAQAQRQWAQAEQSYQQALAIYIEFHDRYRQASTYGQLGLLAESQEQWAQAQQYLLQALEIFHGAGDEYFTAQTIRNLARLWQASQDAALPAAVAAVLGVTPPEAEKLLQEVDC